MPGLRRSWSTTCARAKPWSPTTWSSLSAPASPVLAGLCDQVADAYAERPVSVINAIVSPPDKLQGLADAFRIRGDRE